MFHHKPFKKDITPFAKGGKVVKHVGKGAREQSRSSGGYETLTGANTMARMANSYPKSTQEAPEPESSTPPPPVPMGTRSGGAPTAMMPPSIGEEEE